ncbi:MAG: cysteine desulfurase NifS [Ignavibacteriales bacterium]
MKVYFDNAATTKIHPKVAEKIIPLLKDDFGNPSSIHSYGTKIKVMIEEARETVAEFINADSSEIYFTSGGTEANNFIINGISKVNFAETGRNEILTFKAEHHAVLDTFSDLKNYGFSPDFIDVNRDSSVNPKLLQQRINEKTNLISCMYVNNETGAVNPVAELVETCKADDIFIHSDAVQAFGKIEIDVRKINIDAMTFSGHKIFAPKGIGAAYIKNGTPMKPLLFGGSQERNRRGGTENIIGIVALAEAVKIAKSEMHENYQTVSKLRDYFIKSLQSIAGKTIEINNAETQSPYILSITFKNEYYKNDSEAMLIFLDLNGVAVSNGSACSSGTLKPSHVILSMGKTIDDAKGTLRISFNPENTFEEIDYTIDIFSRLIKNFSK